MKLRVVSCLSGCVRLVVFPSSVDARPGITMTHRKQETHLDALVQQLEILASQVSSQYVHHLSGPRADPEVIQRADEGIKRVAREGGKRTPPWEVSPLMCSG